MRLTRRLFLALFGLTGLVAVGSYTWQFEGLAGPHGVAPVVDTMTGVRAGGELSFFELPTLLWIDASPAFTKVLLGIACLACLALIVGRAPRWAALTLWVTWLSIVQVGQPFLSFQWDLLLVEVAFCSVFLAPGGWRPFTHLESEPHPGWRALFAVLACKVTLESGLVKLLGGDPTWADLTALTFHWWSQPLPTWTSVWIAKLPLVVQQAMCAVMFFFELAVPLLVFGPRKVRVLAAGNYSFYNLLTAVLAVPLLDDRVLQRSKGPGPQARGFWPWLIVVSYTFLSFAAFTGRSWRNPGLDAVRRFDTVNAYGAFARMTKNRAEIILEASTDGATWVPLEFPWKPGALDRRPDFIAPWQPRLDWQMWFASLGSCGNNPWVLSLQQRILEGRPEVLALFDSVPTSPKYLRTTSWEYRFGETTWWTRTYIGPYCPPVMLSADGRLQRAPF